MKTHKVFKSDPKNQGASALIRSVLAVFFKALFHKNSNFRTIRLKVSTFVANGLSFQLSKSDLTHRPPLLTFITRSKKSGLICKVCWPGQNGLLRQSVQDVNTTVILHWPDHALYSKKIDFNGIISQFAIQYTSAQRLQP